MIQVASTKRGATFKLSDEDRAVLRRLSEGLALTQAAVLQLALRDLAGRLERGEPVYVTQPKTATRGGPSRKR